MEHTTGNQQPQEELPVELINLMYEEIEQSCPLLSTVQYKDEYANRLELYKYYESDLVPADGTTHAHCYGRLGSNCFEHTFNYFWLELCMAGYEGEQE